MCLLLELSDRYSPASFNKLATTGDRLVTDRARHFHRHLHPHAGLVLVFWIALGSPLLTGCVQRRLLIRSEPEGALVTIDRHTIGHTPVAVPYTYYGTREIQLQKDGYKTVQVKERIRPPWYAVFPLSFFTENFAFREIYDRRVLDFSLTPKDLTGDYYLLDRAEQMRGDVTRGTVTAPMR